MNRRQDIQELLKEVKSIKSELNAVKSNQLEELPKIKIKSAFEHLRSILDYIALDIHEKYYSGKGRIYFPYANEEKLFKKHLKKNFKNLIGKNIRVYKLLKSVQKFNTSTSWLTTLCDITNEQKHNKLTKQSYQKYDKSVNFAGMFHLSGDSTLIIEGGDVIVNGHKVNKNDGTPLIISDSMSEEEMQKGINQELPFNPIKIEEERVEYILNNTEWDALDLISTSLYEIENLVKNLYKII